LKRKPGSLRIAAAAPTDRRIPETTCFTPGIDLQNLFSLERESQLCEDSLAPLEAGEEADAKEDLVLAKCRIGKQRSPWRISESAGLIVKPMISALGSLE